MRLSLNYFVSKILAVSINDFGGGSSQCTQDLPRNSWFNPLIISKQFGPGFFKQHHPNAALCKGWLQFSLNFHHWEKIIKNYNFPGTTKANPYEIAAELAHRFNQKEFHYSFWKLSQSTHWRYEIAIPYFPLFNINCRNLPCNLTLFPEVRYSLSLKFMPDVILYMNRPGMLVIKTWIVTTKYTITKLLLCLSQFA